MDFARSRLRALFGRPEAKAHPAADVGAGGEEGIESLPYDDQAQAHGRPRPPVEPGGWQDRFYHSADGLTLHAADYGDPLSPWLPVVCLPGLSRNARDFDALARHLSTHPERPRRVVCFDLRGRGLSDWDSNQAHYTPIVEMQDVLDGMAALGVPKAMVVGTSRGGLIAMLMGVARPAVLAGIVLNDIGPALEARGLARLKTYVGRMPPPNDWDDAALLLRRLHGRQFPALTEDEWRTFAWMTWRDEDGLPASDYDPALARTFDGVEFDRPVPTLWSEFVTLAHLPMMVIRGRSSDLLSEATAERMEAEHPGLVRLDIDGEGHPPLLVRRSLLDRIARFVAESEGVEPPADSVIAQQAARFDLDAPKAAD